MKKIVIFIISFLCFSSISNAQWQPTNLGNVGNFYTAMAANDSIVYVGNGNGIFKTSDNGDNWSSIGLQNRTVYSIVINNNYLYAGTDSGIYLSNNNGASWSLANVPILGTFRLSKFNNIVYAACTGSYYCYYTINNSVNWVQSGNTLSAYTVESIDVDNNNIYIGRPFGFASKSADNGLTLANITIPNSIKIYSFNFALNKIYATNTFGISISSNYGVTWTKIFDTTNTPNPNVFKVLIEGYNMIAVSNGNGIFLSNNGGITWFPKNDGLPISLPTPIYTSAIVKCNNYFFITLSAGIASNVYRRPICELFANAPTAATAGVISGNTLVCRGQTNLIYTVPIIANAISYQWFLPYGFYGNSNTNSITLVTDNNTVSGNIMVKGSNGCALGDSSMLAVTVKSVPTIPGLISGNTNVSAGQLNVAYSIPLNSNADFYKWNLPMGANGISTTNSINVNFAGYAQSGLIKVRGHNICGDGNASSMQVVVNNNLNTGATLYNDIGVFPSPASYLATISYTLKVNQHFSISVYDITGRKIKEIFNAFQQSGAHHLTIDISDITTGIYFLKALGEENFETAKFSVVH